MVVATAIDEIAADWPLRWGGRGGLRNHFSHFPNLVLRRVSICAGKKNTEHET
jgi:hypothetical protein